MGYQPNHHDNMDENEVCAEIGSFVNDQIYGAPTAEEIPGEEFLSEDVLNESFEEIWNRRWGDTDGKERTE